MEWMEWPLHFFMYHVHTKLAPHEIVVKFTNFRTGLKGCHQIVKDAHAYYFVITVLWQDKMQAKRSRQLIVAVGEKLKEKEREMEKVRINLFSKSM